jgi:hypothetical protein
MTELINFGNLPSLAELSESLKDFAETVPVRPKEVYLKMDKTGHWVYGADQTEIEPDSLWAVNPFSFVKGYICWGAQNTPSMGKLLGEKMYTQFQKMPKELPEDIPDSNGWEYQNGFSLSCISGTDKGLQARFMTKTKGGVPEVQRLSFEIHAHGLEDPSTPIAIIKLKSAHYTHPAGYGRIYNPVLELVKFVSNETEPKAEDITEAPVRRRRG